MTEVQIHNGEVVNPEVLAAKTTIGGPPTPLEDIDPDQLAQAMVNCVAAVQGQPGATPRDVVNSLLQLRTTRGHKAVWTRFDVLQLFALHAKQAGAKP